MNDDASSIASGPPPSANGDPVPAAAHMLHPLWERAAGRGARGDAGNGGRGRGRGGGGGGAGSVNGEARNAILASKYAPISMVELELKRRTALDGGSSVASDDDGAALRARRKRRRSSESDGAVGDSADDGGGGDAGEPADEGGGGDAAAVPEFGDADAFEEQEDLGAADDAAMLARAAFGGMPGSAGARKEQQKQRAARDDDCTALTSAASDSEDAASFTSSAVRRELKVAFPVSGVTCVGCALPHKVALIDEFVKASACRMSETALYKMAALVYMRDIVEPARKEGVAVPHWSWKDIHAHYTLHYVDPRLQRMENVRSLAAMRKTVELSMLREDEATGERLLDKTNAEQLMKIVALQSKEIQLLEASSTTRNPDKTRNRGRDD
tara:strand:+ start:7828 stop:8982 length:1155 start_codon:yes stop_codon:yes gene_type:complete